MNFDWTSVGVLAGAIVPLLGVPLTMITLYLKSLREGQQARYGELLERFKHLEGSTSEVFQLVRQFEREYTTKAEWVRESTYAREQLDRLTEMVARIETELGNGHGIAGELGRTAAALTQLAKQLNS